MSLYVATQTAVNVYDIAANGNVPPIRSINGPSTGGISCISLDASGNLYVGNAAVSTVTVYGPGANGNAIPIHTIAGNDTGLAVPKGLAIDSGGNLYVLNSGGVPTGRTITVYSPGADGNARPIRTLTGIQVGAEGNLLGLAVDLFDNLYLSEDLVAIVSVYPPGANGPASAIRTLNGGSTGLDVPSGMDFDGSNNLYVADGPDVLIFDPLASDGAAPIRKIGGPSTGISNAFSLAVDQSGVVYVGNLFGNVTVYASGAAGDALPIRIISGINASAGMAIDKPRTKPPTIRLGEILGMVATILGGVAVDGGGLVFVGGIPIPIGPWGETSESVFARGDALMGLAIDQLASHFRGRAGQNAIRAAALELVVARVNELLTSLR